MENSGDLESMLMGYRVSAALSVAAELGLSDELATGPRTVAELATAVGADEETLARLVRVLVTVGVYADNDGAVSNTPLGEGLRSGVPGTQRPLARTLQDPALWAAWGHLGHSVRTGETAFEALHGVDVWTYRQRQPEHNAIFNDNMTARSWKIAGAVAAAYDFSGFHTVVDVGGGQGIVLDAVLRSNDHLTGTVFDREHVVATEPETAALAPRWSAAAGDFFAEVPPADVYLLKSILHDWPDDRCVEILRVCAESLNPGGAILVIEAVLGQPGHEADAAFSDLNMLVLPGGRERTEDQYAALFAAAGLQLTRLVDTPTRMSILEAVKAGPLDRA
ncbi:methyltransferase [Streptomyces sp. SID13031]|uniref:methyltransferase n=1 Tax=Streptomyces sp. SID13031 TaxID=2706046 RepID=UPI0013CD63D8|nr:methyltransferase [Streptomyces sp. SID13031]NEA30574.1 methyltransferase [Streptomyces sp. SID13031]